MTLNDRSVEVHSFQEAANAIASFGMVESPLTEGLDA